jgi:hypothetical protein
MPRGSILHDNGVQVKLSVSARPCRTLDTDTAPGNGKPKRRISFRPGKWSEISFRQILLSVRRCSSFNAYAFSPLIRNNPAWTAQATICVRLRARSFRRAHSTCRSTVRGEMLIWRATSLADRPRVTYSSISSSLRVSKESLFRASDSGMLSITFLKDLRRFALDRRAGKGGASQNGGRTIVQPQGKRK